MITNGFDGLPFVIRFASQRDPSHGALCNNPEIQLASVCLKLGMAFRNIHNRIGK
jgi:hypothetical protein